MSKKNALKDYLAKILKGKSEADLANTLKLSDVESDALLAGTSTITATQAIAIAKFTNTDPAVLLHAQTERDLAALGVQAKATPATVTPSTTTTSSSRSPAFKEPARRTPEPSCSR